MKKLVYEGAEQKLKDDIRLLMHDWKKYICTHSDGKIASQYNVGNLAELFVSDGFYPFYTYAKPKILFIGHEYWGKRGKDKDMIFEIYDEIKNTGTVGDTSIDGSIFHALMFYITYGIIKGNQNSYKKLPDASEIVDEFAEKDGFSYAFMNISKLINEKNSKNVDDKLIKTFIDISKKSSRNFFAEEINLLQPNLIVGMFLAEGYRTYKNCFGSFRHEQGNLGNHMIEKGKIKVGDKEYDYIETYKFSYPVDKDTYFYQPILETYKEIKNNQINNNDL